MRDPERIESMLEFLRRAWIINPDMRLGQLISNVTRDHTGATRDVFNIEDDVTQRGLEEFLNNRH